MPLFSKMRFKQAPWGYWSPVAQRPAGTAQTWFLPRRGPLLHCLYCVARTCYGSNASISDSILSALRITNVWAAHAIWRLNYSNVK